MNFCGNSTHHEKIVNRASLLKNSLGARFDPGSGVKHAVFWASGARFVVAIGSMPTFSTRWCVSGTGGDVPNSSSVRSFPTFSNLNGRYDT